MSHTVVTRRAFASNFAPARGQEIKIAPSSNTNDLAAALDTGLCELALTLDEKSKSRMLAFISLLEKWNKTYNLTAISSRSEMLAKHVFDTLAIVPLLDHALLNRLPQSQNYAENTPKNPPLLADHDKTKASAHIGARVLDVGSGGGIPGMILAMARPLWRVTMIDAVAKKTAFCSQAIAELKLENAVAVHARVEHYREEPPFDLIISRAFSRLSAFVAGSQKALAPSGIFAAMKGVDPQDEIAELPPAVRVICNTPVTPPFLRGAKRHLILMETTHD